MKSSNLCLAAATSAFVLSASMAAADDAPNVVASIKPIHSLVATVMQGVGTPELLIEGAGSPHTYALKPSQAKSLQKADLVFWVAHDLEAFLEKPIKAISRSGVSVELMEAPGVKTMTFREGGPFEGHGHGHGDEQEHAHDKEHGHKDKHAHDKDHGHKDEHAGHDDHGADPHLWLDPVNAKAMIGAIKDALIRADPAHRKVYTANAAAAMGAIDALMADVKAILAPVKGRKFVVFHDAYQYFENRFGVSAAGSITVSPEVLPGAARLKEIRGRLKTLGATCVFSEPQFEPKLVSVVTEGSAAKTAVLDPLGAALPAGSGHYATLIRTMAGSIASCLSKS